MKYIGIVLIIASSSYCGYYISELYKKSLKEFEGILELVGFIKDKIEFYKSPLGEIYSEFENSILNDIGFLDLLIRMDYEGAFLKLSSLSRKNEQLQKLYFGFFDYIGKSDTIEQIKHCEYHKTQFIKLCSDTRVQLPQKLKLSRSLGVLLGLMTALLLL